MSNRVFLEGIRQLVGRLSRLQLLIASGAPPEEISVECGMIGRIERMIDPVGWATRSAQKILDGHKRILGVCTHAGCEDDAEPDRDMCARHDRAWADEVFAGSAFQ